MLRAVLAVVAASLPVGLAAGAAPRAPFLQTAGVVHGLAADGDYVAVIVGPTKSDCDHVLVWNPLQRSVVRLGGKRGPCVALSTGQSIASVAIAGRRAVWVHDGGGNQHEQQAMTATVGFPRRTTRVASATYEIDTGLGDHVGNTEGEDSLLVYNTWSQCAGPAAEAPFRACPAGAQPGLYSEQVWRLRGTVKTQLVGSNARLDVVAAGGGRVAVERAEGTVELLDPTGRTLRRFPFRLGELGAVALTSNALVVQHTGPDAKLDRLAVYDAATGKLAHDWPIAAGLRVADAGAGYAALAGSRTLSVLRLTDGRTAAIGVGSGAIFAQLVPHGLFFAYASPASALKGRVGFLPLARLATKF